MSYPKGRFVDGRYIPSQRLAAALVSCFWWRRERAVKQMWEEISAYWEKAYA
jgi:hypothetical protein